jgi:hypothetical protein
MNIKVENKGKACLVSVSAPAQDKISKFITVACQLSLVKTEREKGKTNIRVMSPCLFPALLLSTVMVAH